MSDFDNTNTFVLFKNDKDGNEKRPDYTGNINIDGVEKKIAAWIREGAKGKFLSGTISEPYNPQGQSAPAKKVDAGVPEQYEDDIPF